MKRALGLLLAGTVLVACASDLRTELKKTVRHLDIPELGVTLLLPGSWNITYTDKGFYQVVATGIAANGSASTFEFRSLPNRLRDTTAKALFANGWYQSVRDNYPNWTFIRRGQLAGDVEGTFEFDGRFENNGTTFRRIGRLRFREERVHAIYYTTQEKSMNIATEYFEAIDAMHKFYKPAKEGTTGPAVLPGTNMARLGESR